MKFRLNHSVKNGALPNKKPQSNSTVLDVLSQKLALNMNKQRNKFYMRQVDYMLGDKNAYEGYQISTKPLRQGTG